MSIRYLRSVRASNFAKAQREVCGVERFYLAVAVCGLILTEWLFGARLRVLFNDRCGRSQRFCALANKKLVYRVAQNKQATTDFHNELCIPNTFLIALSRRTFGYKVIMN